MKKLILMLVIVSSLLQSSEDIPNQDEVAKLYVATFNRAPDKGGLDYWINSGLKLSEIAQSFFDQPETQTLYPSGTSNADFITSVYANLFNRTADTAGLNYWENELNIGSFTKNSFIQAVINGAQNTATSNDADILSNKTTVGLSFSEAGMSDVNDAKNIMIGVSDNAATMASAVARFGISLYIASSTELETTSTNQNTTFSEIDPIWKLDITAANSSWVYSPAVDSNGNIYVTSYNNLYSVSSDGTLQWTFESTPFASEPSIGSNGIVYIAQKDGSLVAVNDSGVEVWRYESGAWYGSTPAIGSDGTIYYSTSYKLHAVNSDGSLKWEAIAGSAAPSIDSNGNIYSATSNGVFAFDSNGNQKWFYTAKEYNPTPGEIAIGKHNILYYASYNTIVAIGNDGKLLWSYETTNSLNAPAIDKDGVIYTISESGVVYAINLNGTLKWSYKTACNEFARTTPAIGSDGTIYVNVDHYLYGLSSTGNVLLQDHHLADSFGSIALTQSGLLLTPIGKFLGAYTINNSGYQAGAPWPSLQHDNFHSAKSD